MFWGAPLLGRELETGTFRLVWTQSITRRRWLLVKIALVGLTSIVIAGALSLIVTWQHAPVEAVVMNRIAPGVFDARGFAAAGYAAFAFTVGLTIGALLRRTLPAMAATLISYAVVRVVVAEWVRVHFATPLTSTGNVSSMAGSSRRRAAWSATSPRAASGLFKGTRRASSSDSLSSWAPSAYGGSSGGSTSSSLKPLRCPRAGPDCLTGNLWCPWSCDSH